MRRFVHLGGIFSCQVLVMAARVADAIALLGNDGMIVSPDDYNKFEALIGDYFIESECDSDENVDDEEMECGK